MIVPQTMCAVQLTGHGGLDRLLWRDDVPTPRPGPGQVLVRINAAGMNNTDINTRIGWYNQNVTGATTADGGLDGNSEEDGSWSGGLTFPRIQGADAVGRIAAVGGGVDPGRVGERVICAPYVLDPDDQTGLDSAGFLGSEFDGAFAQFTVVPAGNAVTLPEDLPVADVDLATLPCSGGTAMNMLLMAGAAAGDVALVTGASGGVGQFLVQILKILNAEVVAVAGRDKMDSVRALGADHVVPRQTEDLCGAVLAATGGRRLSLVADVVGGDQFPAYLDLLRRGGRYVTAGAIAGPMVNLDLRSLYLRSLSFFGSTVYRPDTFPTLIKLVTDGKLRPKADRTFPLAEIGTAQSLFLEKKHVGSMVLLPPAPVLP